MLRVPPRCLHACAHAWSCGTSVRVPVRAASPRATAMGQTPTHGLPRGTMAGRRGLHHERCRHGHVLRDRRARGRRRRGQHRPPACHSDVEIRCLGRNTRSKMARSRGLISTSEWIQRAGAAAGAVLAESSERRGAAAARLEGRHGFTIGHVARAHARQVLMPDPGWPNYAMAAAALKVNCATYPCDAHAGWLPDPGRLQKVGRAQGGLRVPAARTV